MFQTGYPPEIAKNFDTTTLKERISRQIETYNKENCTYLSGVYMIGTENLSTKQTSEIKYPYLKVSLAKNIKEVRSANLEFGNQEEIAATLVDKIKAAAKELLEKKGFLVHI